MVAGAPGFAEASPAAGLACGSATVVLIRSMTKRIGNVRRNAPNWPTQDGPTDEGVPNPDDPTGTGESG